MPFTPCNISLERMVERQTKAKAAAHERRQARMQRNELPAHIADSYERFDSAVLVCLQVLHRIEQHAPEVLERFSKPEPVKASQ